MLASAPRSSFALPVPRQGALPSRCSFSCSGAKQAAASKQKLPGARGRGAAPIIAMPYTGVAVLKQTRGGRYSARLWFSALCVSSSFTRLDDAMILCGAVQYSALRSSCYSASTSSTVTRIQTNFSLFVPPLFLSNL